MSAELLKSMAGIDMLYVPYKSNPQAVTDLLDGQVSVFLGDVSTALPPVRAGKLKGLAVSGLKRSPLAPDLPTIDEAGLKGYELTSWFGAYAPAKTPKPIIDKLNAGFRDALRQGGVGPIAHRRNRAGGEHAGWTQRVPGHRDREMEEDRRRRPH